MAAGKSRPANCPSYLDAAPIFLWIKKMFKVLTFVFSRDPATNLPMKEKNSWRRHSLDILTKQQIPNCCLDGKGRIYTVAPKKDRATIYHHV